MEHFIPVTGDLYDRLGAWAAEHETVRIRYTCNNVTRVCRGTVRAIFKRGGVDLLSLSDGTEIRIDRIASINGLPLAYNC